MNARTTLSWQRILAEGFSSAADLLDYLQIPMITGSSVAEKVFKTKVPRGFAARMELGNPLDPLLLQVLAVQEELDEVEGFSEDPLQETQANPLPGLIHKYPGRVLLTFTGSCAVNCRFCFRRNFPYESNNPGREGWESIIEYIAQDNSISEVILSGGDPLLAKDLVLAELFEKLERISHVTTVRIHTRIPVVLPERITSELLEVLAQTPFNKVIVLHVNHAQELSQDVEMACGALREARCQLLNQSVLLSGINDKATILAALSHRLLECGVMPYYLHLLDKVRGVAHFNVQEDAAQRIFRQLQALLPGYLVPRLVREEPGKKHKTLFA